MVDGGRLPLRFALITFIIAFSAHWATKSHRVIGEFLGVNSPITRPILDGPPRAKEYIVNPDLVDTRVGDDAASRSDPPFTRTSPG